MLTEDEVILDPPAKFVLHRGLQITHLQPNSLESLGFIHRLGIKYGFEVMLHRMTAKFTRVCGM
jgi:hypothetical protein